MSAREEAAKEAAGRIGSISSERELWKLKMELSKKWALNGALRNSEILAALPEEKREGKALELLRKRPMRTISGVAPVAVMTLSDCPHGRCSYCPKGENTPNAYTGFEPATMRGIQYGFDAFEQVTRRVEQLEAIGHSTEKVELIIQGGTFPWMKEEYKQAFVKGCFDALNERKSKSIGEAHALNEKARHRCIGLTIETRPDWCRRKHIDEFLSWGATRVELGVQVLSDEVYAKVNRGHSLKDVVDATRELKDSGLKVLYHMMPGLWQGKEKDVEDFRRLFEEEEFKPDMIKIYPCLVLKGTRLYEEWKRGEFKPYDTEEAAEVISEATKFIPPWCRVMRITRDIPTNLIVAGVKKNNLRQIAEEKAREKGVACRCIRCREVGLKNLKNGVKPGAGKVKMSRIEYEASKGKEVFLSYEDESDSLYAFLRLRLPGEPHRSELQKASVVRELHVYGRALELGAREEEQAQHKGFGARLLKEAERISSEEWGVGKMAVISGVGVREYYARLGFGRDGPFMSKELI